MCWVEKTSFIEALSSGIRSLTLTVKNVDVAPIAVLGTRWAGFDTDKFENGEMVPIPPMLGPLSVEFDWIGIWYPEILSEIGLILVDPVGCIIWAREKKLKLSETVIAFINDIEINEEVKQNPPKKLRPNQEDKIRCRAIAQTLWDIYPEMNISEMCNHRAIQVFGNGKQYEGKDTIRNWIKDLDPRPEDKRIGRPKKYPAKS